MRYPRIAFLALVLSAEVLSAQVPVQELGDSVLLRFPDAELRTVVQAIGNYLDRPVLFAGLPTTRVTLETPRPVPRSALRDLLEGLASSQGLELIADSSHYRLVPRVLAGRPATTSGPRELFVVRLRHARAMDVASTLARLFGGGSDFSDRAGQLQGGALSDQLRRNRVPAQGSPGAGQASSSGVPGGGELGGPVTIVPDDLTNSLIVRGSETDFTVVRQAIEQLDVRPLQVLIQVLIVELRRDRSLSIGTDVNMPPDRVSSRDDATVSGTLSGGGLGTFALRVMKLGAVDLDVTIRAAQARGDARIVSRPVLLASNGQEARILVGSQRPFVQVSRSLPTDLPSRDQVIQYKDVGTKLTVIPTINAEGYVSLDVLQEVNSATNESQFNAPIISTREAATKLLVRDSQTVVIGGLQDEQRESRRTGIPLLSRVPLIGALFGGDERNTTEVELFLFITPIVLRDDDAARVETTKALREAGQPVLQPERR